MIKRKKIILSTFILVLLSSCELNPVVKNNTISQENILNKTNIDKLQTIIPDDKIILPNPLDINSEIIKKEIQDIGSYKTNSDEQYKITYWSNSVIRWNDILKNLVNKYKTDFLNASRIYSLLSVAQYDTLVNTYKNKYIHNRSFRSYIKTPSFPSEKSSIAETSYQILVYFYPQEKEFLYQKAEENKNAGFWGNEHLKSDIKAGEELGKQIAEKVIEYSKNDNSQDANENIINNDKTWKSNNGLGLTPSWGKVKPWLFDSVENIPINSPPDTNSDEFKKAVDEIVKASNSFNNTYEDPYGENLILPSFLNSYISQIIESEKIGDLKSSAILAFLNMSVMDSGISSWNTKYKYQLERPYKLNKDVKFADSIYNSDSPSYISENMAFMSSGSEVIKYIFPAQTENISLISDKYFNISLGTGINYRFDLEEGSKTGIYIGLKAVELYKNKATSIDSIKN